MRFREKVLLGYRWNWGGNLRRWWDRFKDAIYSVAVAFAACLFLLWNLIVVIGFPVWMVIEPIWQAARTEERDEKTWANIKKICDRN